MLGQLASPAIAARPLPGQVLLDVRASACPVSQSLSSLGQGFLDIVISSLAKEPGSSWSRTG